MSSSDTESESEDPSRPSQSATTQPALRRRASTNDVAGWSFFGRLLDITQFCSYLPGGSNFSGTSLFIVVYGLLCFFIFGIRALVEGCFLKKPGQQFWAELVTVRKRLWDLSKPPSYDLKHHFWKASPYRKLHYLTNNLEYVTTSEGDGAGSLVPISTRRTNLVILIHGWPDTCMLWNDVIRRLPIPLKEDTTLVAVDLPGFGGSDGLKAYNSQNVLGTLFRFILAMREVYLEEGQSVDSPATNPGRCSPLWTEPPEKGKVILVAHDWGAICGFKLAANAPQLADRFILCNSVLSELMVQNRRLRWKTTKKLYSEWKRDLSVSRLPWKAASPLLPVVNQLRMSSYVFIYNLPWKIARSSIQLCYLWSLRYVSSLAVGYGQIMHTPKVVGHIAGFLGPNILTCDTETPTGEGYGSMVHERAREDVSAESIRYYREGLLGRKWRRRDRHALALFNLDTYNHEVRKKKKVGTLETQPDGRLNAPTTVIWGERDPALDARMMLEGIDEFMTGNSQVVRLPKVGHWVPLEGEGPAVIASVIEWALGEERTDTLAATVREVCVSAKFTVMK